MGQKSSILEQTYDQVNETIQQATQHQWTFFQNQKQATYQLISDPKTQIIIKSATWPVTQSMPSLEIGHHYYHVIDNGKQYDYDVDQQEWLQTPTTEIENLLNQWIQTTEQVGGSDSATETAQVSQRPTAQLTVTEGLSYGISDLTQGLNDQQILIAESHYSSDFWQDDLNSNLIVTSNLDFVKSQILKYWKQGLALMSDLCELPIVDTQRQEGTQILVAAKTPDRGLYVTISHISSRSMTDLLNYMKANQILLNQGRDDSDVREQILSRYCFLGAVE